MRLSLSGAVAVLQLPHQTSDCSSEWEKDHLLVGVLESCVEKMQTISFGNVISSIIRGMINI